MVHRTPLCSRRILLGLLATGLLAAAAPAPAAHAALTRCSTDPMVTLSNGVKLYLSADTYTQLGQISSITYTLHGPAGTSVKSVINTGGATGNKEHFVYVADATTAAYTDVTYVNTGATTVQADATVQIGQSGPSTTAYGTSNQYLTAAVS